MGKAFPAPSQPQYKLFDTQSDLSDDIHDENEEEMAFWLNSIMTSQPQYSLFDQDSGNISKLRRCNNSESDELRLQLNLLRHGVFGSDCKTKEGTAGEATGTDDQQVPAASPLKLLGNHYGENCTMYGTFSGTGILSYLRSFVKNPTFAGRSFSAYAPKAWNQLPNSLGLIEDYEKFKNELKTYLEQNCSIFTTIINYYYVRFNCLYSAFDIQLHLILVVLHK